MIYPPFLFGSVLIFWGIETQRVLIAIILALIIEASHFIKTRYDLDKDDFVKISDLTSLIFLGAVSLVLLNNEPASFLRITTGWVPLIFSPLIIAQLYSTGDTITIGTRLGKKEKAYTHKPIDFRIYYIINCIFAAATGNSRSVWFYVMLGGIIAFLLIRNRGRSYSFLSFAVLFSLTLGLGYLAGAGLEKSHKYVMQNSFRFLHKYYRGQLADPYKAHVNFGDTGRLKYSGKIVMRVDSPTEPPLLFREASFTTYRQGNWFGNQGEFELLVPSGDKIWDLIESPHIAGKKLQVELGLPKEKGLLPYPAGGYQLTSPTIFEIEQHKNGTVKIVDGAPIANYELFYHPEMAKKTDTPRDRNLEIPTDERYVLGKVVAELSLPDDAVSTKIVAIQEYFATGFGYSLKLIGSGDFATPLGNFLLSRKSGFCEYYASATVLLLRYLGIPSRYSVGFAVFEKSFLEGKYIVRNRHAHAWAEAYVQGKWVIVDTTPSSWLTADAEQASVFEGLQDLVNLIVHKYRLFQIGSGRDYTLLFSIIVVILTTLLVIRIYRRMRLEEVTMGDEISPGRSFSRIKTPFSPVIDDLLSSEVKRLPDESFVRWAARCRAWSHFDEVEFAELYRLHLRLRYDPVADNDRGITALQQGAEKYVKDIGAIR